MNFFFVAVNNSTGSYINDKKKSYGPTETYEVEVINAFALSFKYDLIKMDIEGSEYDIIDEICREEIQVRQILIEFHHHFDNIAVSSTKAAVAKLNRHGYKIFTISPDGHEVSFILADN